MAELTTSGVSSAAQPIDHPEQPGVPAAGTPGIHLTESTAPIQPPVADMDPSDLATGAAHSTLGSDAYVDVLGHSDYLDSTIEKTAAYVSRGHEIIATNMAAARRLAAEYPQVAALVPAIENALHALFDHAQVDADDFEPTPEQQAAYAAKQVDQQASQARQKLTEEHAAALEKIEQDRIKAQQDALTASAPPADDPSGPEDPAPVVGPDEPVMTVDDAPAPPPTPSVFDPAPAP